MHDILHTFSLVYYLLDEALHHGDHAVVRHLIGQISEETVNHQVQHLIDLGWITSKILLAIVEEELLAEGIEHVSVLPQVAEHLLNGIRRIIVAEQVIGVLG